MAAFTCGPDQLASVPEGTVSLKVQANHLVKTVADYRALPRSVTELFINDRRFSPSESPLPDWITSLTLINVAETGQRVELPPKLEKLELSHCRLTLIEGIPDSLLSLQLRSCSRPVCLDALPATMDEIVIEACPGLEDFSFLPTDRVESFSFSNQHHLSDLNMLPTEVGSLRLDNCYQLGSLAGIPQGLISLSLRKMELLESLKEVPRGLRHLAIEQVSGSVDLPRLRCLESISIDRVTTEDGVEYTSGEQYLIDSRAASA